jgi:hypothetical protein
LEDGWKIIGRLEDDWKVREARKVSLLAFKAQFWHWISIQMFDHGANDLKIMVQLTYGGNDGWKDRVNQNNWKDSKT